MNKKELALALYKIEAVKFGEFKLKSGLISPIYIDLRILISYPKVFKKIIKIYIKMLNRLKFDRMLAVPYTAIPIASAISIQNNKPFIYTRKEVKDYGTKKKIEGKFIKGEKIVLVDDLITTGLSKIESMRPAQEAGLKVKDVVVLIFRDQGGKEALQKEGCRLYYALSMDEMLKILVKARKITKQQYNQVVEFYAKK